MYNGNLMKLTCPRGITGGGGAAPKNDTTCLDDDEMSSQPGMPDPAALTVPIQFTPGDLTHRALLDLYDTQTTTNWVIGWSDGPKTTLATNNSAGVITYPTTRTFTSFDGYVADAPLDFPLGGIVESQVSIQRTTKKVMHYKTP